MNRKLQSGLYTILFICLFLSGIFWLPSEAAAQERYEIRGTVWDADAGETLPGANIWIPEVNRGTTSGPDGKYKLSLEPGEYEIIASFIGFDPDTARVTVQADKTNRQDFYLSATFIVGEQVTVYADRVGRRVKELARLRNENRKNLQNYVVDVHKLGLLYEVQDAKNSDEAGEHYRLDHIDEMVDREWPNLKRPSKPADAKTIAYSERVVEQMFILPKLYGEKYIGRRSSDNFFSESEIFSTGGGSPLDLNDDKIEINILSEVVSVIGPVSENAPSFYEFEDEPAGAGWPENTTKITVIPKSEQRALFEGVIFVDDNTDKVIGMDLKLNSAGDVFTGVYSLSGFRYTQQYETYDGYWLPSRTEIEARLGVLGFKNDFIYRDRWVYSDYKINTQNLSRSDIPLSGSIVMQDAGKKDREFWAKTEGRYFDAIDQRAVEDARTHEEDRFLFNFFMSAFQTYYQVPEFLENFYFTNISDFYRFNRVEGHYLGAGLRTPASKDKFQYKVAAGYATQAADWRYYFEGTQFIPGTPIALEGNVYKKLSIQFADQPYEVGPVNLDEFRYTLTTGLAGYDPRNYFEREGISAGIRIQPRETILFRANYIREEHKFLPVVADNSFFNNRLTEEGFESNLNPRVGRTPSLNDGKSDLEGFTEGKFSGFEFHLQYDNRQYRSNGIFRNYLVRKFGWFTDHLVHWSDSAFGTQTVNGFDYLKYRSAFGIRVPLFDSHFLLSEIYFGGSDRPLPAQRQFSNNGFFIEDYLLRRPFLSLGFNEGIGNRVSVARIDYDMGTAFTRLIPIRAISQSGIRLRVWGAGGLRHFEPGLMPLTPWSAGAKEQIEAGFSFTRILGLFSIDFGIRLKGDTGSSAGISFII